MVGGVNSFVNSLYIHHQKNNKSMVWCALIAIDQLLNSMAMPSSLTISELTRTKNINESLSSYSITKITEE